MVTPPHITIGHSPDPDDAFMYYGLHQKGKNGELPFDFTIYAEEISLLNQWGTSQKLDVTALSFFAYCQLSDKYQLFSHGASFGNNYGPIIVTSLKTPPEEWANGSIAIPGPWTTAFLASQLFAGKPLKGISVPFREVVPMVLSGECSAGVIIHEEQLTWMEKPLHKIVDLGEWWMETEALPLPLGVNTVSRKLPKTLRLQIDLALRESIEMGLQHRKQALSYAQGFSPELSREHTDKFISMYVNDLTLGKPNSLQKGKKGMERLIHLGIQQNLLTHPQKTIPLDFVA